MVQNTGQDDWSDAHLTLVSGRPISFIQDLYTPLYVHRPTVQPRIPASPTPQTYASDLMAERGTLEEPTAAAAYAMSAAPPVRVSSLRSSKGGGDRGGMAEVHDVDFMKKAAERSIAATGAELGTALFAYHIDVPVSVPRQQSAMIPFVAAEIWAERVSVYNVSVQAGYPLSGVRLKNTTDLHLMGGPLTVFETQGGEAGYVGDALMDDTEPQQTRLLTYALDLAVDADVKIEPQSGIISEIRISRGSLRISRKQQLITKFTFKNHSAAGRIIVVEHSHRQEWQLLEPQDATERTSTHHRFDVPAAGSATANFTIREERIFIETLMLLDAPLKSLLVYAHSGEASQDVQAALEEVQSRREKVAEVETSIADANAQLAAITQGQERIRKNMEALDHKSDLYRRYVGELDKQETQIGDLTRQNEARQADLAQARADLGAYIGQLNL